MQRIAGDRRGEVWGRGGWMADGGKADVRLDILGERFGEVVEALDVLNDSTGRGGFCLRWPAGRAELAGQL